jgi:ABC-type branched-subunit amino acid transport system ATPase component
VAYHRKPVLWNVDYIAPRGKLIAIVGPNGSGKTTFLDVVSGQRRPTTGRVLLDGEDLVDHLPEDRAATGLIRSFQDCRLYPELTVEETLLVAEDARRPAAVLATTLALPSTRRNEGEKRAAVGEAIARLGLERFRHTLISELSTGTRRVVDLATIVAARPRVLLLDEPTAGIAQREAEAFGPLLRRLHEVTGATILLVEHDVPLTVSLCDRLVVMEAGRVVSAGEPEAVMADPVAIAAYLGASPEALARSGLVIPKSRKRRRTRPAAPVVGTAARPRTRTRPLVATRRPRAKPKE